MTKGLQVHRKFTTAGEDPFASVEWGSRDSRIANPDGSVVFEMKAAEIPTSWSQVATDIIVSKYFRKAGVPQVDDSGTPILDADGSVVTGPERSARQTIGRLAATWRHWGEAHGYFASTDDAQAFEDELAFMLVNQMASPNSPQWFNTGLNHAYGITGTAEGFWFVDPESGETVASLDSYTRPAPHACFPEGTRITTRAGFQTIEKIEPGDEVLTHGGRYRTVRDTMQRQVDEGLVTFTVRKLSATPLTATSNHPVLVADDDGSTRWVPADDLRPGDFVVVGGAVSDGVVPDPVDLGGSLGPNFEVDDELITTRNTGHRPSMTRILRFDDPAVMRLLGRWVGDGSIGHETRDGAAASVNFVFDAADVAGAEDVDSLMQAAFGVTATREEATGQRTAHLRYTRRPLARWFLETFGEGFAGKRVPQFVFDSPAEHRRQFLVGMFQADGCIHRSVGYLGMNFDHSNQDLAEGVWRLARSLGYAPAISGGTVRPGGTVPHFRVQISAKDAPDLAAACGIDVPVDPASGSERRLADGTVAYRVTQVTTEPFFGTVYNFQVDDDESYVANGIVVHNCFIQSVRDDLVNEGGIMDLWVREARLFKFGSGTGTNFSSIRAEGESLSGGGKSSGLMSFLRVGDRAAGAIKSGGTTRRAAKMVILDLDHPDIEVFIDWKVKEERKVRALIEAGYPSDFNGEAYQTVAGQNSNNSVRVPNEFVEAVAAGGTWDLTSRTTGETTKTIDAQDLWTRIAKAAWECADPGVQFDTTINEWHTSPAGGRIRASNPCSEYMFLDNTACNLASLNLTKFYDDDSGTFDVDAYRHAIRLWTMVLEISVTMAQFPSAEIARGSYDYRTLGLGYANLGSLLMRQGIPYDSAEGRAIAGALTAIMTGHAYATSAEMASVVGPFARYPDNRESMLRVIRNHRRAAYDESDYDGVSTNVVGIDQELAPADLLKAAHEAWDLALDRGEAHGFRNAQVSVIAPTGCLVGGSLVPTERGLVRLATLGDPRGEQWQDLGIDVATDQGAQEATKFYVNGAEPVVTVTTGRGYRIQGTPTHRIRVVSAPGEWQWRRFGDIQAGDVVPLALHQLVGGSNHVALPPLPEAHWTADFGTVVPRHMSADLAELVGYFMGDGSLHAKGLRFCVAAEDFDVTERLTQLGKELFGIDAHLTDKTGYTEVAFHSVPLTLWWEACGFAKKSPADGHQGKGYLSHIPDAVLYSNDPAVYGAFLRGLFEADGTVTQGAPSWTTASLDFSYEVQSLLLALGLPTNRRWDESGWGGAPLAVLRTVNQSYNGRFLEAVDFMGSRKRAAVVRSANQQSGRNDRVPVTRQIIDRLAPHNTPLRRRLLLAHNRHGMVARRAAEELYATSRDAELGHLLGFFYDTVADAELGEEQLTYDLSVPANVTYVANGFVSHNTIGLQMDCDTTGVEPDFALVKFKKLAGGGYFKIANQSVAPALRRLGYTDAQISDIVDYVVGTMSLADAPHINKEALAHKGMPADAIANIEAQLRGVFDLRHAFNVFTIGEEAMARLGFTEDEYASFDFDLLAALGFSPTQVVEANDAICGRQTIEGAPHLLDQHLAVFDTANKNGRHGRRFIHHTGHIQMMAAAQPFISGAISKTINMPNEVTVDEIEEAYMLSWELGLKSMALYRDGSKASQPLSATADEASDNEEEAEGLATALEDEARVVTGHFAPGVSPSQAYAGVNRPRFLLPAKRRGYTQEARVGGHKVFLRTGEYEDGTIGELFIDLAKEGATLRGVLSCFAIAVSKGLQYGVPLEEFVDTFTFQTFEPRGMVEGHPNIKMANSMVDYIFRALGLEYLGRTDLVQVPPTESDLPEPPRGMAVEAGVQLNMEDATAEAAVDAVTEAAAFADSEATAPSPNGNGAARAINLMREPEPVGATAVAAGQTQTASVQSALGDMMGDAPLCDTCGHITVRNGSCYRCLNCGNSMGCS